jgi:uncharacterized iron-regulated membrane protein
MKELARRSYAVHSAVGVATGLLLFAVTLTGVTALFRDEVTPWEHPSLRFEPSEVRSVDGLLAAHSDRIPEDAEELFLFLPTPHRPSLRVNAHLHGSSSWFDIDPRTGEVLPTGQHGFGAVWRRIHTDALLGRLGRYSIGLLGLLMLMSTATGLLAHRKMFRQLFTWRRGRSFRTSSGDLHKLLGVWGSAAHLMFGFTGAILGLLNILILVSAFVAYGGDKGAAVAAVLGPPLEPSGTRAELPKLQPLLERAREEGPPAHWNTLRIMAPHDAAAQVEVAGFPKGTIAMRHSLRFEGRGERNRVHQVDWVHTGPFQRAFGIVQPLHYADFGGGLVKLLYVVLGLCGAFLIGTGLVIWLDARAFRRTSGTTRWLMHGTAGVLGGLPASLMLLPIVDRVWAASTDEREWICKLAFVGLLGGSLLWSAWRPPRLALRELLGVGAGASIGAVAADAAYHGVQGAFASGPAIAPIQVAFVCTGLFLGIVAWRLPTRVLGGPITGSKPRGTAGGTPERQTA